MSVKIVNGELVCPFCGGNFLHQGKTSVFERGEDDTSVALTVVENFVTTVNPRATNDGNPSARRQGMTIEFGCEWDQSQPHGPIVLCIAQHKGVTEVYWEHEGR